MPRANVSEKRMLQGRKGPRKEQRNGTEKYSEEFEKDTGSM